MVETVKRLLKLLVSLCVYVSDRAAEVLRRLLGRSPSSRCVVLYYHSVSPEERLRFASQMELLRDLTQPLKAKHEGGLPSGGRYAVVTFDDGFRSVIENALPALEQYSVPATIFVPTAFLGRAPHWGKFSVSDDRSMVILSEAELARWKKHNLLDFGSHSITHPKFTELPDDLAKHELQESKRALEAILQEPIELFSFPHGEFEPKHVKWARDTGYLRTFSIDPSLAFISTDEYAVGRVCTDPQDWRLEFRLKLLGAYRWLSRGS